MGYRITAQKIADYLSEKLIGDDIIITQVKALNDLDDGVLSFSKNKNVNTSFKVLVLVPKDVAFNDVQFSYVNVDNPRLAFAKVVKKFFENKKPNGIDSTVIIGKNCNIDESVSIGPNCIIGNSVSIGKDTILNSNIILYDNTKIGKNCYIKSGSIIGEDGFGFDFENDRTPVRIPHIGNVEIGNNVEIGAKNTIARATLGSTTIHDSVKTDIALYCKIGKNTIITACAEVSGSVTIGQNCWIGPNSSIIQKVQIGNNVTVGIGAVITSNIKDNMKFMGLDALDLKSLLKLKKRIVYGK
jgi:UDP-3-O-[3-hydroxymyristoyl] glucosamine N-acyltransferase